MSVVAEQREAGPGRRAPALVARTHRPGRRHRRADGDRVPRLGARVSLAGGAHVELASGTPRQLPDLAARPAERRGSQLRVRGLRRVRDIRRQPRRVVRPPAALADVGRHDGCGDARGTALRRLARGRLGGRGIRLVRADGSLGAEHANARADARRGRPLARDRDPDRDLPRGSRTASSGRSRRCSTRCRWCPRSPTSCRWSSCSRSGPARRSSRR